MGCAVKEHDWPLGVWPQYDGARSRFMHWLTLTHTQRWHQYRYIVEAGPVHQGQLKSCPVEPSEYVLTVCRYVERAASWRWSRAMTCESVPLQEWPMAHPAEWLGGVNEGDRRKNW
jgi:putative transposase